MNFKGFVLCAFAFVVAAFFLYLPSWNVPFLLDDLAAIPLLHPNGPLDLERVPKVLWPDEPGYAYNGHFRPVGWATFVADDAWFGFSPQAFRATALAIHGLLAFVVFLVTRNLTGRVAAGLAAGAFCLTYGGSVEPVVWVCHRFTILAALLFAIALLPVTSFARSGRGLLWITPWAVAAALSKDSMITEIWGLVALVPFVAPKGRRFRRVVGVAFAVAVSSGTYFVLRYLCLGSWLPAFTGGGNVAETSDLVHVLQNLPATIGRFLAPLSSGDASERMVLIVILATHAGLLALWWKDRRTVRPGFRAAGAVLATVLLAGLPVFFVDGELSGSRRFYLPAATLAITLGAASRGPALALVWVLAVAGVFANRGNQERYLDAGEIVRQTVEHVEAQLAALAPGSDLVVTGHPAPLPASWRGAPVFGDEKSHLFLRFRKPLRGEPAAVTVASREVVGQAFAGQARPLRVLGLGVQARDGAAPRVTSTLSLRMRGESEVVASGPRVATPVQGARWPDQGGPDIDWIRVEVPKEEGVLDRVYRLVLKVGKDRADFVFRPRAQGHGEFGIEPDKIKMAIRGSLIEPLLPVANLGPVMSRLDGPGHPAEMWIEEVPDGAAAAPGRASPKVRFLFGGRAP